MIHAIVTGTIDNGADTAPGKTTFEVGATVTKGWQSTMMWDADDPRLDGELTLVGNTVEYEDGRVSVSTMTRVLVNDLGRWEGTDTGVHVRGMATHFIVVQGEDAHEWLTAVLVEDWYTPGFYGAIVPIDRVPAFPEPAVPRYLCAAGTDIGLPPPHTV